MALSKRRAAGAGALALILGGIYTAEGGFVNSPYDHGGATRYGVSEAVAREHGYLGPMRFFPKHCDGPEQACADGIYVRDYIERPGYMEMISIEPAVADKLINMGVNMGPRRPSGWFRETLGYRFNGAPLSDTVLSAYQLKQAHMGVTAACEDALRQLATRQEREYRGIAARAPSQRRFLNGWVARARKLHPSGIACGWAA